MKLHEEIYPVRIVGDRNYPEVQGVIGFVNENVRRVDITTGALTPDWITDVVEQLKYLPRHSAVWVVRPHTAIIGVGRCEIG